RVPLDPGGPRRPSMTVSRLWPFALALTVLFAASTPGPVAAQSTSAGPVDPAVLEDLVAANRILAMEGILDGLGHVSIRHPGNASRYLIARSLAPALVTAADIMEFDPDSSP